jgi:hypothetical protein
VHVACGIFELAGSARHRLYHPGHRAFKCTGERHQFVAARVGIGAALGLDPLLPFVFGMFFRGFGGGERFACRTRGFLAGGAGTRLLHNQRTHVHGDRPKQAEDHRHGRGMNQDAWQVAAADEYPFRRQVAEQKMVGGDHDHGDGDRTPVAQPG